MNKWNKFLAEGELKTVGIVACLNDKQQFLVIRRSNVDDRGGQWTIPGGHIDDKDNSIEACYSHMLYCMALTTRDLKKLNNEILRILKPGGINIYTVRHTNDGDFQNGIHIGEDLYENDGFIVHYFSEDKVNSLLNGFKNTSLEKFEEGNFPRRLFFVVNEKK